MLSQESTALVWVLTNNLLSQKILPNHHRSKGDKNVSNPQVEEEEGNNKNNKNKEIQNQNNMWHISGIANEQKKQNGKRCKL